jgi:hypothetical protein
MERALALIVLRSSPGTGFEVVALLNAGSDYFLRS